MAHVFVRGTFYDRMGEESLKFKLDADVIDKVITLKTGEEIDSFFDDLVAPPFADNLLNGIVGDKDVAESWKNNRAFNVALEEFVFGVGTTKEEATMQWAEVMDDDNEGGW